MTTEPFIGVDMATGPDQTVIVVRDKDGRYRIATEEEVLHLRKREAWNNMKRRFQGESNIR